MDLAERRWNNNVFWDRIGPFQALIYDKALRLPSWSISEEEKPSDKDKEQASQAADIGTLTNLMAEDAYNVMSFFWVGHYVWAIPLKVRKSIEISSTCDYIGISGRSLGMNYSNRQFIHRFNYSRHASSRISSQIAAIIFLLYLKLGISAIIGAICCILIVTPMQLILGKRLSANSTCITVSNNFPWFTLRLGSRRFFVSLAPLSD